MLRKWLKIFCLVGGLVLLVLIARNIQRPFWKNQSFSDIIVKFQKDSDIFPYRIREIWWNRTIILKSITERSINILWGGNYFYLPLIGLLWLINKKKWWSVGLIVLGLVLMSIEKDPNPGKYLPYLIPLYILAYIK